MVETARKGEATATARVHTKTMKYLKRGSRGHFAFLVFWPVSMFALFHPIKSGQISDSRGNLDFSQI